MNVRPGPVDSVNLGGSNENESAFGDKHPVGEREGRIRRLHLFPVSNRFSEMRGLLDPRAAALDQNNQHQNKEHSGSYPDNRRCVHRIFPFRVFGSTAFTWCEMQSAPPAVDE